MTFSKAQKFTLLVFAGFSVAILFAYQSGTFIVDWNGLFNGTLQSLIAGVVIIPLAILVNRYLYHRKSKN